MCIRDSAQAVAGRGQVFALFWATDEADPERIVESWLDQHACLLYTSDAADERSSVDLGGSRIIKKKNQ